MIQETTVSSVNPQDNNIDEATLKSIATVTNGRYYVAANESDLENIYGQINRLERSDIEKQIFIRWQEQFQWFATIALLSLIVAQVLLRTVLQVIP